jgi:hypothetical protein
MTENYEFNTKIRRRHETAKAYLCEVGDELFWIPKSQIFAVDFSTGRLVTSDWWAEVSGAKDADKAQATPEPASLPTASALYRKLAMKYHPDRNPDAEEFMRDLNEFWQAVKDDLKR